jgi:hypothetical protein
VPVEQDHPIRHLAADTQSDLESTRQKKASVGDPVET